MVYSNNAAPDGSTLQAILLDGSYYVRQPNVQPLGSQSTSLALWFYASALATGDVRRFLKLGSLILTYTQETHTFELVAGSVSDTSNVDVLDGAGWKYYALVYTRVTATTGTLVFYLNGNARISLTITDSSELSGGWEGLDIGSIATVSGGSPLIFFDFSCWPSAKTAAQLSLYQSLSVSDPGLVLPPI